MKSKFLKKIRHKKIYGMNAMLLRYFVIFSAVIIVLISVVCYGIIGGAFFSQARDRVKSIGVDITHSIVDQRLPQNAVVDKMLRYESSDGVDVYLLSVDGNVVIPEKTTVPENWNEILEDMFKTAKNFETGDSSIYASGSTLNYVSKMDTGHGERYLLVQYPLSITAKAVSRMQVYVLVVAGISVLVSVLVSYLLSQKLSEPIKNISQTASKLAKGDYNVRFESAEYQEIAQLSDTLNYATDEMRKSGDLQKELLANVSHDFKTPLTMIKAYASMVNEISGDDPEKRGKHLQVIIDESDRLAGLVNDVLQASKISSGIEQINKKVFNLTEYLYSIINKFDYLQEMNGYKFMVDIDQNLYTLADEEKIGQVIYNLLSNAVNYTGEDKTVYISLKNEPENDKIKFSVRDTGKGISEEELENIWDRYYRLQEVHSRPVKGTGLGLNIVKIILENHKFNFGVTSVIGKGSTFYVDFPSVSSDPNVS